MKLIKSFFFVFGTIAFFGSQTCLYGASKATNKPEPILDAELAVRVIDSQTGQPIGGALVGLTNFLRKDFVSPSVLTSTNGEAKLRFSSEDAYGIVPLAQKEGWQMGLPRGIPQPGLTNSMEIEMAPVSKISGTVKDASGKPAGGLDIVLFPPAFIKTREIKTDAKGHFEFYPNTPRYGSSALLVARDPARNLMAVQEFSDDVTNYNFVLKKGITVSGRVEDAKGQPLSKATVSLIINLGSVWATFGSEINVDKKGRFEIRALPEGYKLSISAKAEGFGSTSQELEDGKARIELAPLVLPLADRHISGKVVDEDDKPISGAFVQSFSGFGRSQNMLTASTDANGDFDLKVCEGQVQLMARKNLKFGNIQAGDGETNLVIRLRENPGVTKEAAVSKITGSIRGTDGKPVANQRVTLYPNWTGGGVSRTDGNGLFRISRTSPQQSLLMARDEKSGLVACGELETDTTNVDLRLGKGLALVVRAESEDGKPITNATVTLTVWVGTGSSQFTQKPFKSNEKGQIEMTALPLDHKFSLSVSARGYGSANQTVEAESEARRIELAPIVLKKAGSQIMGQVFDKEDKPISGANVSFSGEGQPYGQTTTDSKGKFMFKEVCEGPVSISANYGASNGYIQTQAGDTNVIITLGSNNGFNGFSSTPAVRISGLLRDSSGAPVPNLRVKIYPNYNEEGSKTDANGQFKLRWSSRNGGQGNSMAAVRDAAKNLVATAELDESTTNLDLRLGPGLVLAGKVQDEKGKPITNALARLTFWVGNSGTTLEEQPCKVDAQGHFQIPALPQDEKYDVTVEAKGYGSVQQRAQREDGQTNRIEMPTFVLRVADKTIEGVVVDEDEKPVSGASVGLNGEGQPSASTQTDSKGRFVLKQVCEGKVSLSANRMNGGGYGNIQAEAGDTNVVIALGVNGSSGSSKKLVGFLRDSSGAPVPNYRLKTFPNHNNDEIKTDANGQYRLRWSPRQYGSDSKQVLVARDLGKNLAVAAEFDESMTNLDLRFEPGLVLIGKAQDEKGNPITNASINLTFWYGNSGSSLDQQPYRADTNGNFQISALPQMEKYDVSVSASGYGSARQRVTQENGQTNRIELQPLVLRVANKKIEGMVVDSSDKPVSGAWVSISGEGQPNGSTRTDSKGRFAFKEVCEGSISVSANGNGGPSGNIQAEAGETNIVVTLGVYGNQGPVSKVSGILRDPSGAPVPNFRVKMHPNNNNESVKTDANGQYKIRWNSRNYGSSQKFVVLARDTVKNMVALADVEDDATNLDLRFEPGWILTGKVQDAEGKPLAKASLDITFWTGSYGSSLDSQTYKVNELGVFKVPAVPPNQRYAINVSATGYGSASINVKEDANGTNVIELGPIVLRLATKTVEGIVVDADEKPVSGANVSVYGEGQPSTSTYTDSKGHFIIKPVCEGPLKINASSQRNGYVYANAQAEGGDTNLVITLNNNQSGARETPRRVPLKGKPLPSLQPFGFEPNAIPANKPLLLCLFDAGQRPSRRAVRLISEKNDLIKEKGLGVLLIQAALTTDGALQEWKDSGAVQYPLGHLLEKTEATRWVSDTGTLPWFILTDASRLIVAEGFSAEELESKIKEFAK